MRETSGLEFKQAISNSFLKTVSAYANYHDGKIVFGVDDTGKAIGLADPIQTCLDIENKINDSVNPTPHFSLEADAKQRTVTLSVEEGPDKPYLYRGKAFKRSDSATVEVDRLELGRLVLEGQNMTYDQVKSAEHNLAFDTLHEKLKESLGITAMSDDLLKTLGLLKQGSYNHAAELLADRNACPGIDIVRFGTSISDLLDRRSVSGVSILTQLDEAMGRYELYYKHERVEGRKRILVEDVPEEAFREAIANALIHRTWDVRADVKVAMFPDRIEVSSPGGLPMGISEKEYLSGRVSVLRNPILAEVFFRLDIIEKFGTGILRIREAYRGEVEKPRFDIQENSITVILPVLGSLSGMTSDECMVLDAMAMGRRYTRRELEEELGLEKTKMIRLLNALVKKDLVSSEGESRARRYVRL